MKHEYFSPVLVSSKDGAGIVAKYLATLLNEVLVDTAKQLVATASPVAHPACTMARTGQFCTDTVRVQQLVKHPVAVATMPTGADNTQEHAVATPTESGVLFRPEFADSAQCRIRGYGRDGVKRKPTRTACSVLSTSSPPSALDKAFGAFKSQHGATQMANANSTSTPAQGTPTSPDHDHPQGAEQLVQPPVSAIIRAKPKGPVHSNTLNVAVQVPTEESGASLCPNSGAGRGVPTAQRSGCGLGAMVRKAIGVATFTFETPSPPDARSNAEGGFFSHVGHETMKPTTTGASPTTTPDHTSLSFVRIEHKGKRNQRLTSWFNVPDEDYCTGNATGYRTASELMAWVQSRPADYATGMIVREVMAAAFAVLAQPHTPNGNDKRGCAVSFLDAMAGFLMFAASRTNHQAYLAGKAQRSENWARESAEIEAERNRAIGQRLAAARKAKREAKAMDAGVASE